MTPEDGLQPCDRFTVLETRSNHTISLCDVCEHLESAHRNTGRRTMSGAQIENLRRRIIIERWELQQQERQRMEQRSSPGMSTNGDPELR